MFIMDLLRRMFDRPWAPPGPIGDYSRGIAPDTEPRAFAPHCDGAVLHAPGECVYCDHYPDWQEHRRTARIAFTGHDPKDDEVRCPSEQRRPLERINRWPGNRPSGGPDARSLDR
jgi:hypothetical protein